MRFRLTSLALACAVVLATGGALAQDSKSDAKKKEQPAPKSKQEQTDKAAADKAKAAEAEKADAAQTGAQPEKPEAAVNTLEDLFAAYGTVWTAQRVDVAAPKETVVWKELAPAKPAAPKKTPKQ